MNDLRRIADCNPVRAEDLSESGHSAEAEMLLRQILTQPSATGRPASRRHVQRRVIGGLALAAILVAGVFALSLWPSGSSGASHTTAPPMRLVVFSTRGDNVVAKITDPQAAAAQLTSVFQAHGLNIHVQAIPVSPSLVGTIVYSDVNSISAIHGEGCLTGGGACDVGLVIPADFTGEANVTVGRAATADETFHSSADVFGPGEALHCSGILGEPAASALPILKSEGITATWSADRDSDVAPSGYVIDGAALSRTNVMLNTASVVPDTLAFKTFEAKANDGC